MKPLIQKIIRKRYRRESNEPARLLSKTVIHYNDQGEACCSYDYLPNGFVHKWTAGTVSQQDQDEGNRAYDIAEQKRDEAGKIIYEKWIFRPAIGWESNYIFYAGELPSDNILVTGTKELFSQYDDSHRHTQTNTSAIFHYWLCNDQGQPLTSNNPEAIVTIEEKYQYNESGNLACEQQTICCSNAPKYREETERKFYYDTAGNQVKEVANCTHYDHAEQPDHTDQTRIYDKIVYQ